jgi:hypothetical protein
MPRLAAIVGIGIALCAVLAGSLVVLLEADPPVQVLYPAGTVVRYPQTDNLAFSVRSPGGTLVGEADVDHSSDIGVVDGAYLCGFEPSNETFSGPAWHYSIHEHLDGGRWWFGALCGRFANVTVTQAIEVVYW